MILHPVSPKKPIGNRYIRRSLQKVFCLFLVSGCLVCGPAAAENSADGEATLLTLEQAIVLMLEGHPHLGVYAHRREAYEGLADEAGIAPRPTIGISAEDFLGTGAVSSFRSTQSTLSISWVVQDERIESRVQSARTAAQQVDVERRIEALDLAAETAGLFVRSLVQAERTILAEQAQQQANRTVAAIQKRVDAGRSPRFERLQAEVELFRRELEVEDLHHELASTRRKLQAMWAQPTKSYTLIGELSEVPTVGDVDAQMERIRNHPALELFATQQRVAESEIELARIESKPQWQFSVGVRRFETTDDFGLVASASIPWGRDRSSEGRIRRLEARQAEYATEAVALEYELDTQLFVLLQEIRHSRHVIETLESRVIPTLSSAYDQATEAYDAGRLGYPQWTDILLQRLAAQQDLLSAYEAIHLQHIELQRLTGTSLPF